jgi:hypothetical protein
MIGVLADDFSITVFKVPSTWNSNDAEYSIVSHTPLTGKDSSKGNQGITGPIISIEFFEDSQGQILLAVGGSNGVAMIKFEQTVSLDRVAQKDILKVEENVSLGNISGALHLHFPGPHRFLLQPYSTGDRYPDLGAS